jgi:SAM-dependent methyltransferase
MKKNEDQVFKDYSKYYDLLYKDKDYKEESRYINDLLKKFSLDACEILEFGSGTGGHANILTKKYKYKILGVDQSKEMIGMAKNNKNFKSIVGDMRSFDAKKKFDCVLALFHVVSYLTSAKDINKFFKNANKHLPSKGKLIFDCWYSPAVNYIGPSLTVKKIENRSCEVVRIGEPKIFKKKNQVLVNFTNFIRNKPSDNWFQIKESHLMRHYSKDEIGNIAKRNGFKLISSEQFMTGSKSSKNTWGVCFILEKK